MKQPATFLKSLFELETEEARYFREHIRTYNGALAFPSLKANTVIIPGKSCYVAQGQVYSDASDCFPQEGQPPTMNQLWFVETDECAGIQCEEFDVLRKPFLIQLIVELQSCNPYARGYQMMGRHIRSRESARCQLVIASDMAKVLHTHSGITFSLQKVTSMKPIFW